MAESRPRGRHAAAGATATASPAGNVRMLRDGDFVGDKTRTKGELVTIDPDGQLAAGLFEARAAELVEGETPHPDVFRARRAGIGLSEFRRQRDAAAQAAARQTPARPVEMRIVAAAGAFFLDRVHPKGALVPMTEDEAKRFFKAGQAVYTDGRPTPAPDDAHAHTRAIVRDELAAIGVVPPKRKGAP